MKSFLHAAAQNEPSYASHTRVGGSYVVRNLEKPCAKGPFVTGAFVGYLWDLYDPISTREACDGVQVSMRVIWNTLNQYRPLTPGVYHNALITAYPSIRTEVDFVAASHEIIADPQCKKRL